MGDISVALYIEDIVMNASALTRRDSLATSGPVLVALPNFDLTKIMARVAVEHPDWCQARLDAAERDYRRYAMLAKLYQDVFPTKDADKVWHCHIICTKDYMTDCEQYYGRYLHHNAGVEPETNDLARLQRLHYKHFGTDPAEIAELSVCNGGCCSGCD